MEHPRVTTSGGTQGVAWRCFARPNFETFKAPDLHLEIPGHTLTPPLSNFGGEVRSGFSLIRMHFCGSMATFRRSHFLLFSFPSPSTS